MDYYQFQRKSNENYDDVFPPFPNPPHSTHSNEINETNDTSEACTTRQLKQLVFSERAPGQVRVNMLNAPAIHGHARCLEQAKSKA